MTTIRTNSLRAAEQLLAYHQPQISLEQVKDRLLSHPDYPSLYALHQVLNEFGLPNNPIEADHTYLGEMQLPFIAYMEMPDSGTDFALVNKVDGKTVEYTAETNRRRKISK